MASLSDDRYAEIIQAFDSTSRYLESSNILTILTFKGWWVKLIHLS